MTRIVGGVAHRLLLGVTLVLVGLGAFSVGVLAASLTVQSGTEVGHGSTESGFAITWWAQSGVSVDQVPSPAPSAVNGSAATPTLLTGLNSSYAVGAVKAGDAAVRWDFQLKSPPILTEFELTISVLNLTGTVATTLTVYLETPATSPVGTVLVSLFLDNGVGVTGFRAASQLSQQCSAFGTCP